MATIKDIFRFIIYLSLCYLVLFFMSKLYQKAYEEISSQNGLWMWLFLFGFLFIGNFIIISIVRFLVFAISQLDPFPRASLWVIRTYTSIMLVVFVILIYNNVNLNSTKQFFMAIGFIVIFLYFSWTFYKIVIESQIARLEYETNTRLK